MSQPGARVDTAGMQRAGQLFEGASSETTKHLQSVQDEIRTLQAGWGGQAASAFTAAMQQWENNCNRVIKELNTMINAMGQTGKQYDAQESDAVNLAPKMEGLPGI